MRKGFHFKQFFLYDDHSVMKIGTDAVLLGAWSNVESVQRILDIGTGSGIIALMLAQRSNVTVDAVEIDKKSADQASDNFNASPWKHNLQIFNASFQDFSSVNNFSYDLIVSNPPYFVDSLKSEKSQRNLARHNDALSYEDLIKGISKLLSSNGRACIIMPVKESNSLIIIAEQYGLFCNYQTEVISKKGIAPYRILMEFSKMKSENRKNAITVYKTDLYYTDEFKILTRDFYLKF